MAVFTVSDDIINSKQAAEYFTTADRRVMIGVRATLEMLAIPVPEYAKRKPPGPTPARAVATAFAADYGELRPTPVHSDPLSDHRLKAAIAKARQRAALNNPTQPDR
jgi:hypothetical protein